MIAAMLEAAAEVSNASANFMGRYGHIIGMNVELHHLI
jgi:hypothetical protein